MEGLDGVEGEQLGLVTQDGVFLGGGALVEGDDVGPDAGEEGALEVELDDVLKVVVIEHRGEGLELRLGRLQMAQEQVLQRALGVSLRLVGAQPLRHVVLQPLVQRMRRLLTACP